jgi:hypothetical protein
VGVRRASYHRLPSLPPPVPARATAPACMPHLAMRVRGGALRGSGRHQRGEGGAERHPRTETTEARRCAADGAKSHGRQLRVMMQHSTEPLRSRRGRARAGALALQRRERRGVQRRSGAPHQHDKHVRRERALPGHRRSASRARVVREISDVHAMGARAGSGQQRAVLICAGAVCPHKRISPTPPQWVTPPLPKPAPPLHPMAGEDPSGRHSPARRVLRAGRCARRRACAARARQRARRAAGTSSLRRPGHDCPPLRLPPPRALQWPGQCSHRAEVPCRARGTAGGVRRPPPPQQHRGNWAGLPPATNWRVGLRARARRCRAPLRCPRRSCCSGPLPRPPSTARPPGAHRPFFLAASRASAAAAAASAAATGATMRA